MPEWRTGRNVLVNVYDGDRPVCQCHTVADAKLIVRAVNAVKRIAERVRMVAKKK